MVRTTLIAFTLALACTQAVFAQGKAGDVAGDFPPGVFSDGGRYRVDDFAGKVLVLFFYEQDCPRCRGEIPKYNAIVEQYRDAPVKFIAVAPRDTYTEALSYLRSTKLDMPVFADPLGIMEKRYDLEISLNNIRQFRVIGPDGKIAAYRTDVGELDRVLKKASWQYREEGQSPKLATAVNLLEWNQFEAGMKTLRPLLKAKGDVATQAQALADKVMAKAQDWSKAAEESLESDPVNSCILYSRIAACFPDDELGKAAATKLKELKATKPVKDELAARAAMEQISANMTKATTKDASSLAGAAAAIAKRFPTTPTGQEAKALADEVATLK